MLSLFRDRQEALRLRGVLTAHKVVIPDVIEASFIEGLRQAKDRLAQSGKLGMFAGPAKRAVQECEVDGRQPSTAEDIDLCLQAVTLEDLRRRMLTSWRNQLARVGGAELGAAVPEDVLGHLLDDLGRALSWPRTWAQLRADLAAAGVGSPAAADADTLGRSCGCLHPGMRPDPAAGALPLSPRPPRVAPRRRHSPLPLPPCGICSRTRSLTRT